MTETANFLAVDLGASSGRVLLGQWDGTRFSLRELHRFENGPVEVAGHLHWDVLRLWAEIKRGIQVYATEFDAPLVSIGIDTWAVDYGLLDKRGNLLGNPYHYRDSRTSGVPEAVGQRVPRADRYQRTGLQMLPFNTLYQLASQVRDEDPQLHAADTLLMIPDLLNYWLTGRKAIEYTNASTTEFLDCRTRTWATELMAQLYIPTHILPPIISPGTVLGPIRPEVMRETGLRNSVAVVAPGTHDTASAVAGVPGLDNHSCYISSGTWSLVGVEIPEPITGDAARELNVTNEGGVANTIRLLKNVGGLWLLQESQRSWQKQGRRFTWSELLAEAEQATPFRSLIDPDASQFLHPEDMPTAIQEFCQSTGQPIPDTIGAVVRCCLESLALRYRWVIEALEGLTAHSYGTVRVVGGGSQNRLLCQMTADASGRTVVAGPVEATALGNIMVQAIASGYLPDLAAGRRAIAASVQQETFEPRRELDWEAANTRFRALL